ncbi:MAG: hypothetical protein IPK26_17120 [Planctomycetes bacterium]|nr:hypothetical protein [Planctomycetota bacterium]
MRVGEQLQRLEAAGLRFAPGVESELVQREVPALLEDPPFTRLLEMLGDGRSREPFEPLCDQLWMCHTSRIHDPGAYVAVLLRLERMTGGVLGLSGMTDHLDRRARRAWVEFTCRGHAITGT